MAYIYKNEVGRPVNIGGYQFAIGQELKSDVIITRFKEAVSNGFLGLENTEHQVEAEEKSPLADEPKKTEDTQLTEEEAASLAEQNADKTEASAEGVAAEEAADEKEADADSASEKEEGDVEHQVEAEEKSAETTTGENNKRGAKK